MRVEWKREGMRDVGWMVGGGGGNWGLVAMEGD